MSGLLVSAVLFHVGCGDDDENVSPNTGGKSASGGKTGAGGASNAGTDPGAGGKLNTGGSAAGKGGSDNRGGESSRGGSGPLPSDGGSGGVPVTPEGGSAGAGGVPDLLPPCTTASYDAVAECFAECSPIVSDQSEQFLNRCSEASVQCTKFTAPLPKLGANGALPPLP